MPFATNVELMRKARQGGYAVGAFNINNMESAQAVVGAAVAERSPVIIACTPGAMKYAGVSYLSAIARTASEEAAVPVSLHLDHGLTIEHVQACLDAGFSSVMIDASSRPFEENVRLTRMVVKIARPAGVSVEAELGRIAGAEDALTTGDREASMTDPEEAAEFCRLTGVDALAVSIGNAHGWYKGEPKLDFDRLGAIRERVDALLVLHGASGIPDDMIRRACAVGVDKINIDTEIRDAFRQAVAVFLEANPDVIDPRKILGPAREAMKGVVARKMRLFGSSGKA